MQLDQIQKVYDLLRQFEVAVFITQGAASSMHARPMAVAAVEENCDLWFFTSEASVKVNEIKHREEVLVVCQSGWKSCVTVCGTASLHQERDKLEQLWKPSYKAWFPLGVEDPDLILVCVSLKSAEYWDSEGLNGLKYVFQSIKAVATGNKPEVEEGEQHGYVTL